MPKELHLIYTNSKNKNAVLASWSRALSPEVREAIQQLASPEARRQSAKEQEVGVRCLKVPGRFPGLLPPIRETEINTCPTWEPKRTINMKAPNALQRANLSKFLAENL